MRGRQVMTSIVRDPIPGPLQIGPEGPVDNSTAVHTEHTLAFPADHYDFWARELGVPRDAWNWAWWGENLTVDGVDEEILRIGDLVTIGTAEFEVTSPRVPCFKVAWRVGQPDTFLLRMMETGRVGFHVADWASTAGPFANRAANPDVTSRIDALSFIDVLEW